MSMFKDQIAELRADLDLWQKSQRHALEAGHIDDARKITAAIKDTTASIKALLRERCEELLGQLEAALEQQSRDAKQEKALDDFRDEMRHVPKH